MATFTNQATLTYNGNVTSSNIITGQLTEVLSATKTAVVDEYAAGGTITYVVSLVNSGATDVTGLTITGDLGEYTSGALTLVPLDYVAGSLLYYTNGALQATPALTTPPLAITGISVPAGGNATLVYETRVNEFAPLVTGSTVTNTVLASGGGLATDVTAEETVTVADAAALSIIKSLSPTVVAENGQLTYTFTIQNTGNAAAVAADDIVLNDTFDPILDPITVTFNGAAWAPTTNYTYDTVTGEFATVAGQITVPAAKITQAADGSWTVNPGVATLVVTGTV